LFYHQIKKFLLLSELLINVNTLKSIYFEEFICVSNKCLQLLSKNTLIELKLKLSCLLTSIVDFKMISHINFIKLEVIKIYSFIPYNIGYLLKNFMRNITGKLKRIY